jgi:hypothetical protein
MSPGTAWEARRAAALVWVLAFGGVWGPACSPVPDPHSLDSVAVSGAQRGDARWPWTSELTWWEWNALNPQIFDVYAQGLGAGTQSSYVRKGRLPGSGTDVFIKVFEVRPQSNSFGQSPDNEVQVGRYLNELASQLREQDGRELTRELTAFYHDFDAELSAIESHVQAYGRSGLQNEYWFEYYKEALAPIANWRRLREQDKRAILDALFGLVKNSVREPVASELLGWTQTPEGDVALVYEFVPGVNVGWRRVEEVEWFEVARAMQMAAQLKGWEERTRKKLREADAVQVLSDGETMRLVDADHELVDVGASVGERLVRHGLLAEFALPYLDVLARSTADLVEVGEHVDGIALLDSTWRAMTTTPSPTPGEGEIPAPIYLDMRQGWKFGLGPVRTTPSRPCR